MIQDLVTDEQWNTARCAGLELLGADPKLFWEKLAAIVGEKPAVDFMLGLARLGAEQEVAVAAAAHTQAEAKLAAIIAEIDKEAEL